MVAILVLALAPVQRAKTGGARQRILLLQRLADVLRPLKVGALFQRKYRLLDVLVHVIQLPGLAQVGVH